MQGLSVLWVFFTIGLVITFGITGFAIYKEEQVHKFKIQHYNMYEDY